jgi:hypothetical protein
MNAGQGSGGLSLSVGSHLITTVDSRVFPSMSDFLEAETQKKGSEQ